MKKMLALAMAFVMSLSLAACGSTPASTPAPSEPASAASAEGTENKEPVNLRFYNYALSETAKAEWWEETIANFEAEYDWITVEPISVDYNSMVTTLTNDLASGLTLHYWIGASDPALAQGQPGILQNPQILQATWNTVLLGVCVAIGAGILGLLISYVITRSRGPRPLLGAMSLISYVPFLIPGIAFGAAFIAQFGAPIGPLPSLYGTFALLVIAGIAATIPFAVRSATAALSQVSRDVEESAAMAGAGLTRRLRSIIAPLTARGLLTGGVLVFVQMVRDLSLVVLLATPAMPVLAVLTYQYSSENFTQLANAVTVVIAVISVGVTLLARRAEGAAQPWNEKR